MNNRSVAFSVVIILLCSIGILYFIGRIINLATPVNYVVADESKLQQLYNRINIIDESIDNIKHDEFNENMQRFGALIEQRSNVADIMAKTLESKPENDEQLKISLIEVKLRYISEYLKQLVSEKEKPIYLKIMFYIYALLIWVFAEIMKPVLEKFSLEVIVCRLWKNS